jgi:general nucleoside transport system permease protein
MPGSLNLPVLLGDAVTMMTPLLFAALGGLFTELSGMLNIALEGLILIGAFAGVVAAAQSGSLLVGVVAGMVAGMAAALLYGLVSLKLKANEFIAGLATNLFASGLTVVLSEQVYKTKGVIPFDVPALPQLSSPFLSAIPVLGTVLFNHDILVYGSWVAVFLTWVFMYRTPAGMRLRATGSSPKAIASLGLSADRYRLGAILVSGAACGLAGCHLSFRLAAYVPNVSSGRGWIALVAIYLGGRKPLGIMAACLLFATAESFSNFAQGFMSVPPDFILAIPYIVTLAALIAGAVVKKARS